MADLVGQMGGAEALSAQFGVANADALFLHSPSSYIGSTPILRQVRPWPRHGLGYLPHRTGFVRPNSEARVLRYSAGTVRLCVRRHRMTACKAFGIPRIERTTQSGKWSG
ncbi:hypothetical protein [Pelagibacterium halotolerans]|uniref:hypothetical protein n=1 Tax=Pelagibacterium halotolerans TaxID=531813 RepID=UPI003850924E